MNFVKTAHVASSTFKYVRN